MRKEPSWRTLTLERLRQALSPAVSKGDETSLVDQLVKNLPAVQETQVDPWVKKILWRRA